ncbi:hypothetical protein MPSI1_003114 [Malassezia psittaci]|uniref:Indoleamine 2,3-dioxygenase n=1 Tax=Malassezia psittaci TaxID=1821823 RepID=A0AAF0JLS9_9BASI|nr:hypothetical protein MPSI1_003114 [Malassezia psittaci]
MGSRSLLAGAGQLMKKGGTLPSQTTDRLDTSTLAAADFDVDVRSGFLPPEQPLTRLPGPTFDVQNLEFGDPQPSLWECMLDWAKSIPLTFSSQYSDAAQSAAAQKWRNAIRAMPVTSLTEADMGHIKTVRRACVVLAFLSHFYMHAQIDVGQYETDPDKARSATQDAISKIPWSNLYGLRDSAAYAESYGEYVNKLPSGLAIPFVAVSERLGLPPVLTYATTVLWNWTLKDASKGLTPSNMEIKEMFTNTGSESHFFLTSLLIELQGVEALTLMRISLNEAFAVDKLAEERITCYLKELANVIRKLTVLLSRMQDSCDPDTFYWDIRPWFKTGDATFTESNKSRVPGWILEGVSSERSLWTGPSAGQSTLIHALDLFLDVDHARIKRQPSDVSSGQTNSDSTFMERMQLYMPSHHRAFLRHLQHGISTEPVCGPPKDNGADAEWSDHPIRALVLQCQWSGPNHPLVHAYDEALRALRALRDEHMRIAVQYIVHPARRGPRDIKSSEEQKQKQTQTQDEDVIRGTGGTDLVNFLRVCRKNTTDAMSHFT